MSVVLTYENRLRADDVYSVYVVDSPDALSMHPAQLRAMFAQSKMALELDCERLVIHLLSCRPLSFGEPCIIHEDVVLDLQPDIDTGDDSSHDESVLSVASAHASSITMLANVSAGHEGRGEGACRSMLGYENRNGPRVSVRGAPKRVPVTTYRCTRSYPGSGCRLSPQRRLSLLCVSPLIH